MARVATIVSTSHYLPDRLVTNDELARRFAALELPDVVAKLEERTGIRQRWYAPDDWATSDLALPAARLALERAGRRPEDLDLILLGTDSPDYVTPATSTVLQAKLGAHNAGTFDVGCACASFPTALAAASGLIATNGGLRTVLVVGVYLMHRLADPNDPMVFFYGDGAGAAVLEPGSEPGFVGFASRADGTWADAWGIYAGGTAEPANVAAIEAGRTQVRLVRRYPPEVNEEGWPAVFERLARENGFTVDDVAQVLFTQVRKPTIEAVARTIGLPLERAHTIMEEKGYTGSACIPIALDDAIAKQKIHEGDLVVMIGSGVGYNQAGVAFRMGPIGW